MSLLHTLRAALRLIGEEADRRMLAGFLASLALVAIGGALAALAPLALKHLVDALSSSTAAPAERAWLGGAAAYLLAVSGGRIVADIRPLFASDVDQRLQTALRRRFFEHVMHLPLSCLSRRRAGELMHGLDLGAAGCQSIVSHLGSLMPACVELVAMIIVLSSIGQSLLVWLFISTACAYGAIFSAGAVRLSTRAEDVSSASLAVYAHLGDCVGHVETLRCFTAEGQAQAALHDADRVLTSRWQVFNRLNARISLAVTAVFTLSLAGCLWICIAAAVDGQLTAGGMVLASVYMLQMVRPLEVLGSAARDLSRATSFVRPLIDLLGEPPEPAASGTTTAARPLDVRAPSIRLDDVHFGYAPGRPVLRGLNLEIEAGRTTGIVGPSGSGKSSVARLLLRLNTPQAGSILVGGRPISELSNAELRASIGLVPQDVSLLHGTIASNVALGWPQACEDDVQVALLDAQLGSFVQALPRGCATRVGDRGVALSGGERQRVAIARALVRRPAVYVLDEPTSMLDTRTEAAVMQRLRQLTTGSTTLIIAHRLSTVRHADQIVVLDEGRVVARGRHTDLLAAGGLYAQLWREQTAGPS